MAAGAASHVLTSTGEFVDALRPHLGTVTAVARRFAPDQDADDVAQEALLAAWRYRSRFDPAKGSLRAWLVRIVLTECRRAQGSRWRRAADLGSRRPADHRAPTGRQATGERGLPGIG